MCMRRARTRRGRLPLPSNVAFSLAAIKTRCSTTPARWHGSHEARLIDLTLAGRTTCAAPMELQPWPCCCWWPCRTHAAHQRAQRLQQGSAQRCNRRPAARPAQASSSWQAAAPAGGGGARRGQQQQHQQATVARAERRGDVEPPPAGRWWERRPTAASAAPGRRHHSGAHLARRPAGVPRHLQRCCIRRHRQWRHRRQQRAGGRRRSPYGVVPAPTAGQALGCLPRRSQPDAHQAAHRALRC